jgi:signal transduction histidine kinase
VGLGLTIARSLAHDHGGTLELANRPGGGLVATVSLPVA